MVKLLHICGKIMYSEIDVFIFLDQITHVSIATNAAAQSQLSSRGTGSGTCLEWVLLERDGFANSQVPGFTFYGWEDTGWWQRGEMTGKHLGFDLLQNWNKAKLGGQRSFVCQKLYNLGYHTETRVP